MFRIDSAGATGDNKFVDGDEMVGVPSTVVTASWLNAVQEEICAVIEGASMVIDKPTGHQLLLAIKALTRAASPVGTVVSGYWTAAPTGTLALNGALCTRGAPFAALFAMASSSGLIASEAEWSAGQTGLFGAGDGSTTFRLPDLRGEFVRMLDAGRGVDTGRTLGSRQLDSIQNITGFFGVDDKTRGTGTGPFQNLGATTSAQAHAAGAPTKDTTSEGGDGISEYMSFDASRVVRTSAETRPRSVALLACIFY